MTMAFETLRDLYVDQIQDLYSAEGQILDALPRMIDKASHVRLRDGFQQHLEQTRQHSTRLEQIARRLNEPPHGKTCKGMEGLLKEGAEFIKDDGDQDVIDAGLIAAAQRVEHYEMAAYGCARAYARALGLEEDAALLQQTLDEEGETNKRLTQIAESVVNPDAEKGIAVDREVPSTPIRERDFGRDRDSELRP
jgi:ferritin-like metal-binding protein YciE